MRKSFPRATWIPFNPAYQRKLDEATTRGDPMIIVHTDIPSVEGKSREKWVVENTRFPALEIGCQDGHLFRDQGFTDWNNWYGFDLDVWDVPNFTQGDAHRLPFKDKSFTTVVFAEIMEHVRDPTRCLLEALRVATDRIVISAPNEFCWAESVLPFMDCKEKNELDHLTERQQIDKNSRYLPNCLNPKTEIAAWDEEKYEHLWHLRRYYVPQDVTKIPSGRTTKPEVNFFEQLDEVCTIYNSLGETRAAWAYERFIYPPWAFHAAVITLNAEIPITCYSFSEKIRKLPEDYYAQIFTGDAATLIAFIRHV
jgi:hypothetical protein